jgi:hypothetical protein
MIVGVEQTNKRFTVEPFDEVADKRMEEVFEPIGELLLREQCCIPRGGDVGRFMK